MFYFCLALEKDDRGVFLGVDEWLDGRGGAGGLLIGCTMCMGVGSIATYGSEKCCSRMFHIFGYTCGGQSVLTSLLLSLQGCILALDISHQLIDRLSV